MKTKRAKTSLAERKYLGDEPKVSKNSSASVIVNAYNWYNYCYTYDDAKEFVIEYLKSIKFDKNIIKKISQVDADKLVNVGWNCRLLFTGSELPVDIETKMWHKIHMLAQQIKPVVQAAPVVLIQKHIENKASDIIAALEEQIDLIATDGSTEFSVEEYFRKINLKPQIAKHIIEYYKPLYSEIHDAVKGNDPELNYAYRNWKKKHLKYLMDFIVSIISTSEVYCIKVPVVRKTRKKKEKPASKIVAKIKMKAEDTQYKIKSIKSTDIVGAQQLWLFNTKYRVLTVLNAMGAAGLSVKGTTVINFDEKTSQTKTLRKPEQAINTVMSGGKIVLKKLMDTIKCKPKKVTGRINIDIVVLRAIK